jgi:tagatose-6-phosphate ketose/aldose isomerase
MTLLKLPQTFLLEREAVHTAGEIANQPKLWEQTAARLFDQADQMTRFLQTAYGEINNIVLTGAGTSAFIGLSLQGCFFTHTGKLTRAVATTDIVSHPQHYFSGHDIPLIISFARSGNSPESIAALELADRFSKKCFHLIITCSAAGALSKYRSKNPLQVFVLPEEANDQSLAMTGSYSSMLLTGLLLAYLHDAEFCRRQLKLLCASAEKTLNGELEKIQKLAEKRFERVVFLGSGPLLGTATEAALKLQELTDGQVICKSNSYLGFRHGPKAVIDGTTLVVYFFDSNRYVSQYEKDLLHAMDSGQSALYQLGISERGTGSGQLDDEIVLNPGTDEIAEDFLTVCSIVPAQLLAFFKSLQLGLTPDNPSVSGSISRVVEGVNIYPVTQ